MRGILNLDKFGFAMPISGEATVNVIGMPAFTLAGCAWTARTPANTSDYAMAPKAGLVASAATMTARQARAWVAKGAAASSISGFRVQYRFALRDALTTSHFFMGMSSTITALAGVNPGTLTNCVGIGYAAGDTNLRMYSSGTVAQPSVDLGANFPIGTSGNPVYDLTLTSPPYESRIYWDIRRIDAGSTAAASGSFASSSSAERLQNALLTPFTMMKTQAASAVDLLFLKVETPM